MNKAICPAPRFTPQPGLRAPQQRLEAPPPVAPAALPRSP